MEMSTSDVPYLPKEVVTEILLYMPVKSLLRFKTVCRLWQSIISNPQFIRTHSDRIATMKSLSFIVASLHFWDLPPLYFNSFTNVISLPFPRPFVNIKSISSCNGIVCLGNRDCDVALWNPSTKHSKSLPLSRYISSIKRRNIIPLKVSLQFCFDSITNEYKVLRVVNENNTRLQAELYSTNTDSWRKIRLNTDWHVPFQHGIVIKEVLYFIKKGELVSFDFHNEVFGAVPIPSFLADAITSSPLDFKGSLAIFIKDQLYNDQMCLWAMTDVGGEVSWRQQFIIKDSDPEIDWVSTYLSTGQLVVIKRFQRLLLYDYEKKEIKRFIPVTIGRTANVFKVINHTESLASIKGFEPDQYQ